jgi:hypothetical protein
MSLKDEYFAMMVSRFKRWDAEFGMLNDAGGPAGDAGNVQPDEQLEALRATRDATYRQLQEIRTAGESGWRGLQAAVDATWASMRIGLDQAASRSKAREKAAS